MLNYQSPDGALHVLDDAAFEHLLPEGSVAISDEEAAALIAPSVGQIRADLLAAITAERDRREASGFPYQGRVLDSTPLSVQRITAAALAAQVALAAGQPFSLDWTCADNSTLTLDAHGVIGMPVALAQHAAALHAHAKTLKVAAEAAIDQAEMGAIDIQVGWPGWEL